MNRYQRQIQLDDIGTEGQKALGSATVLVVGAGGLGSPILQYLAAAGLGKLGIADMDTVALTNLHRQILYSEDDLGKRKTDASASRLNAVNSEVELQLYPEGFQLSNALNMVSDYDLVIDGTDNFETRYLINDVCVKMNKPWIYGALYKQEGQFALFNANGGPTYRCLYPQLPKAGEVPNCSEMGILGTVSGLIGTYMAHLALQFLLWPEKAPDKQVFYLSLNNYSFRSISLSPNHAAIEEVSDKNKPLERIVLQDSCGSVDHILSLSEALSKKDIQFIDVRQRDELPQINSTAVLQIPMDEIVKRLKELDTARPYAIFCQKGIRAVKAAQLLSAAGFSEVYALTEAAQQVKNSLETNKSTSYEVH